MKLSHLPALALGALLLVACTAESGGGDTAPDTTPAVTTPETPAAETTPATDAPAMPSAEVATFNLKVDGMT